MTAACGAARRPSTAPCRARRPSRAPCAGTTPAPAAAAAARAAGPGTRRQPSRAHLRILQHGEIVERDHRPALGQQRRRAHLAFEEHHRALAVAADACTSRGRTIRGDERRRARRCRSRGWSSGTRRRAGRRHADRRPAAVRPHARISRATAGVTRNFSSVASARVSRDSVCGTRWQSAGSSVRRSLTHRQFHLHRTWKDDGRSRAVRANAAVTLSSFVCHGSDIHGRRDTLRGSLDIHRAEGKRAARGRLPGR